MKAVVLEKYGSPETAFKIKEWDRPTIQEGEALIKVTSFGLNFADVMARKGLYQAAPDLPCVLGYEVVGYVEEVNPESKFSKGDKVLAFTRFGGYAEYVKANELAMVKVMESDAEPDLLALGTQGVTAWFVLNYNIRVHENDNVLVHSGVGGVGSILIQLLKQQKVNIYSTAGTLEKCKKLESLGVKKAFNYSDDNWWDQLDCELKGSLHVVFDAVGGEVYKQGFKRLAAGGKMVTYGAAYRTDAKPGWINNIKMLLKFGFTHPLFLMIGSKTVSGVNMLKIGDDRPELLSQGLNEVLKLYREGIIQPLSNPLYELKDIYKAHSDLENRRVVGKVGCMMRG